MAVTTTAAPAVSPTSDCLPLYFGFGHPAVCRAVPGRLEDLRPQNRSRVCPWAATGIVTGGDTKFRSVVNLDDHLADEDEDEDDGRCQEPGLGRVVPWRTEIERVFLDGYARGQAGVWLRQPIAVHGLVNGRPVTARPTFMLLSTSGAWAAFDVQDPTKTPTPQQRAQQGLLCAVAPLIGIMYCCRTVNTSRP